MKAQQIYNCTTGFPVCFLDVPLEESEAGVSLPHLDLAKESYRYMLYSNPKTYGQFTCAPYTYYDSSKPLRISKEDIDRFQEALTVYIETPPEKGPVAVGLTDATDQCLEFCNSHGLISDLRKCLNEAKKIFSNISNLKAEYDRFPADEYEEDGHVVLKVEVDSDQDTAFREYDDYTAWMMDNISDENLDFFILTVVRTE